MHHRARLSLLLILLLLQFSCKTADKAPEELENEETALEVAELSRGLESTAEGNSPDELKAEQAQDIVLPESDVDSEIDIPWEEDNNPEEEIPVKKIPPRGGMKSSLLSEPETDEESADPVEIDIVDETMTDESITESVAAPEPEPVLIETEIQEDPLLVEESGAPEISEEISPVETVESASTVIFNTELPSENDEQGLNPLLPMIIQEKKEDLSAAVDSRSESSEEKPSLSEAAKPSVLFADEEGIPEGVSPVENSPMLENEYSLSTDSSGKLIINLQGAGWIFLSAAGNSELKLQDKSYDPSSGRTRFSFSVKNSNDYDADLIFMKQDLLKGESEQKVLRITETNSPLAENSGKNFDTDDPPETEINDVSELKTDTEVIENSDNAELNTEIPEVEDSEIPIRIHSPESAEISLPEDLNNLGAAELYKLAQSYEKPGPGQSLETSMELYLKIKNDFPVTEERFMAESRIRYLNKHYFKVQ